MQPKTKKARIDLVVRKLARNTKNLSLDIHAFAERPFQEFKSSKSLANFLSGEGFDVQFPFSKIPTAFKATWGSGKPVIGMLGEYDALPNCGSKNGVWGHG